VAISKNDARRLAKDGAEMGAYILRGRLTIESNGIKVGDRDVAEWLARHVDSELILIAAPIGQITLEGQIKTCLTCGRDYEGEACPHCTEARARLRG
jgi:hypothetical protein